MKQLRNVLGFLVIAAALTVYVLIQQIAHTLHFSAWGVGYVALGIFVGLAYGGFRFLATVLRMQVARLRGEPMSWAQHANWFPISAGIFAVAFVVIGIFANVIPAETQQFVLTVGMIFGIAGCVYGWFRILTGRAGRGLQAAGYAGVGLLTTPVNSRPSKAQQHGNILAGPIVQLGETEHERLESMKRENDRIADQERRWREDDERAKQRRFDDEQRRRFH
jgi:hypothetical protein